MMVIMGVVRNDVILNGEGARKSISRATLLGLTGLIYAGVLPLLLVRALNLDGSFRFILTWWAGIAGPDSWHPIQNALRYVASHDASGRRPQSRLRPPS